MRSGRPHRLWGLYVKEWSRLKRNPAALMAVGLLILMAVLLTIEGKATRCYRLSVNLAWWFTTRRMRWSVR